MAQITTRAIVLRSIPYQDSHRILTLFSRDLGKLTAVAHGVLGAKSKLRSCAALFACGEYVLTTRGERMSVRSFSPDVNYFGAMDDLDATIHSSYLCALCEAALQPGESLPGLFDLLIKAMSYLNDGDYGPVNTFGAFLLLMLDDLGYAPEIDRCAICGANKGRPKFSPPNGGLCCHRCTPQADDIPRELLRFLRAVRNGEDIIPLDEGDAKLLRRLLTDYCHHCIDRRLKPADLFDI